MVFLNYLKNQLRGKLTTAKIDKNKISKVKIGDDWQNMTTGFDLRMWYLSNSQDNAKKIEYVHDLEKMHHELNYLTLRTLLTRLVLLTGAFYTFYYFYEQPDMWDWQDYHDPKFTQRLYIELEEGGDEGEDDD